MSRPRTRPSRDATRIKLLCAAATLFDRQGIGETTIDAIANAAGLTRGAFYSNFAGKDDLVIAMLDDHADRSLAFHRALLARHCEPAGLFTALDDVTDRDDDPLGRSTLLHIELILYVARAEKRRPQLADRLCARRKLIAEIVRARFDDTTDRSPEWIAALLLAIEDGFRLHQLIDPAATSANSFFEAVGWLHELARTRSFQS